MIPAGNTHSAALKSATCLLHLLGVVVVVVDPFGDAYLKTAFVSMSWNDVCTVGELLDENGSVTRAVGADRTGLSLEYKE